MLTHPGVYCLRTNETHWDEATLWETYTMLTDLEAVFRSLKSELGLRPIFHSKERRTDGHLFISVLAYQFVQCIRRRLKAAGIHQSWAGLRQTLSVQQRVTATFRQRDARVYARAPSPSLHYGRSMMFSKCPLPREGSRNSSSNPTENILVVPYALCCIPNLLYCIIFFLRVLNLG
jgi:hypothetical protein